METPLRYVHKEAVLRPASPCFTSPHCIFNSRCTVSPGFYLLLQVAVHFLELSFRFHENPLR